MVRHRHPLFEYERHHVRKTTETERKCGTSHYKRETAFLYSGQKHNNLSLHFCVPGCETAAKGRCKDGGRARESACESERKWWARQMRTIC